MNKKTTATFVIHSKTGARLFEGDVENPEAVAFAIDARPREALIHYDLAVSTRELDDLLPYRGVTVIYKRERSIICRARKNKNAR